MRFAPAVLLVLLLAATAAADFQLMNLSVNVDVRSDGTAIVTETVRLSMDSGSPIIYDTAMTGSDLSSWRTKTKLDIRFHFNRDVTDISEVSIMAQPRDGCYGCVREVCTLCYGTLIIRYKLSPITDKAGSGLFQMNRFKPRTTNYSINPDALSFEFSSPGNIVLPDNTRLTIRLPDGAVVTSVNPLPEGMASTGTTFPLYDATSFSWSGRTTLSNFGLSFQIEEPLSVEVMDFFNSVRDELLSILYSREGLAISFMAVVVVVSIVLLKRQEGPG
jgi:hypothetical protein